jgi:hypothetical protein
MSEKTAVVMPEDEWFKLCAKQCRARRKQYGYDRSYCEEQNGICPECAADAIVRAPAKYRTTPEIAETYDRLPGCSSW